MRAVLAILVLILFAGAADGAGEVYAGRPLAEVLDEFQQSGLKLIFSSDVVSPDLVVRAEPRARSPKKIVSELLAPFGLKAESGPGGTLLVIRDERAREETSSSILGTVRDSRSGAPLKGAKVEVVETGAEAVSGDDGRFEIDNVATGAYTIKVRLPGFVVLQVDHVRVVAAKPTSVVLRLLPSPELVEAVVVTPSRISLYGDNPAGKRSVSREEIEQTPHLADDVNRVVARIPGIASADMTARLHVRGGGADELLILLDGQELHSPYHFDSFLAMFSIINSRAVEQADLSTGGFSARYGDRMSGVLDISSIGANRGNVNNLGASFLNAYFTSEGSLDRGRGEWFVSLRRGYLDWVLRSVGSDATLFEPTYGDVFGKLRYQVSERTGVSGNVLFASDDLRYVEHDGSDLAKGGQSSRYAWLTADTAWKDGLLSRTILSVGQVVRDRSGAVTTGDEQAEVRDVRDAVTVGLKQDWSWAISHRTLWTWGFDLRHARSDYDYSSQSVIRDAVFVEGDEMKVVDREADLGVSGVDLAAYTTYRLRPVRPLTLEFGLRWDDQTHAPDEGKLSPRVNLLYEPTSRDAIRASWGLYRQSQRIDELQVEDGVNEFWPSQTTECLVLGYEHRFPTGLGIGVEVYSKDMSTLRPRFENMYQPIELFPEVESDRIRIAPESGRADGIELSLSRRGAPRFSWWAGYVLSRVEDRIDGAWVPRGWDQTHAITASVNFRFATWWNLSLAALYHTGWPTTPVLVEAEPAPEGGSYVSFSPGERNSVRLGDYKRLDARLSRHVPLRSGYLTFFLEVINLSDRRNACCGEDFSLQWRGDENVHVTREYDYWLPFVPSFGINWQF